MVDFGAARDHHLAEMAAWAEGRKSYTNYGPNEPWPWDVIAVCDAAEVQKHAAAATAFGFLAALQPSAALDGQNSDGEGAK